MKPTKPLSTLYLVGFRCTGKTSVGRALALALNRPFADADQVLVDAAGATVDEIVARGGWEDFRAREKKVLARLSGLQRFVIATGGGVVLDPANRIVLRQTGTVVWLRASADTIFRRMGADDQTDTLRPALTDKGIEEEIRDTLALRDPLYREIADLTVDTDRATVDDIRGIIMTWLGKP